jgi:organic radical activating enzyme
MANNYCSQKFWWLTVEPEHRKMSSCCVADTISITPQLLATYSSDLFNVPELVEERSLMLAGTQVASCKKACWDIEAAGLPSTRQIRGSYNCTHTDTHASVELLNLVLGTDCNLTCSYCCKQYSTAWLRDINDNGPYLADTRYEINANDRIVMKLGQKVIKESSSYKDIIAATTNFSSVKKVQLSGGEPFLYNGLVDIANKFDAEIEIFTGLGVSNSRFSKILDQLPTSNTTLVISAENTGAYYEFNRNGNTYENFLKNLDTIVSKGFNYHFACVVSNVTIHGLDKFQQEFGTSKDYLNICVDPVYLQPTLIDDESKQLINSITYKYHNNEIKQSLLANYTQEDKNNFITYITEFVRRRNLDLTIFPEHFINWINDKNN